MLHETWFGRYGFDRALFNALFVCLILSLEIYLLCADHLDQNKYDVPAWNFMQFDND